MDGLTHTKQLLNLLCIVYNGTGKHEGFVGFEKACSSAKT